MADGQVIIESKLNTDGVEKGTRDLQKELLELADATEKTAGKMENGLEDAKGALDDLFEANLAADLVVDALKSVANAAVDVAKESIQAAADIKASNSQFAQTFKGVEKTARKSLENIAKDTGITATRMQDSYTKIFAFAKTSGSDTESALNISERAMRAAADTAAYYDMSIEDATETLQSFLKGNYENDAALGIAATETTRNAKANELYAKSFDELSESQKVDTLLAMVEAGNEASGALGQAAREADSWTNVAGELQEAWRQLLGVLGSPILENLTPAIQRITEWLQALSDTAASTELKDRLAELRDTFADAQEQVIKTGEQYDDIAVKADFYAKKLEELEAAGLETADSQAQYRAAAQALSELLPDLNIEINEQTGLINMSKDALLAEVEAMKQKAMFAATEDLFTEALKAQAEAALAVVEAERSLAEAQASEAVLLADIEAKTGMAADEYIRLAGNLDAVSQGFASTDIPGVSAMFGDLGEKIAGVTHEEQALVDELIRNRAEQQALQKEISSGKDAITEYGEQVDVLTQNLQEWQTQHNESVAQTSQATLEATEETSAAIVDSNREATAQMAADTTNALTDATHTIATTAAEPLQESLTATAETAGEAFENTADTAKTAWGDMGTWFDANVTSPVKTSIEEMSRSAIEMWTEMEQETTVAWQNMVETVRKAIQQIQGFIDSVTGKTVNINVQQSGSGVTSPTSYSGYNGEAYTPAALAITPQLPQLASGSVIPPMALSAARSRSAGISEDSMDMVVQKLVQVIEENGVIEVHNYLEVSGELAPMIRLLYPEFKAEAFRKGNSLAVEIAK